MVGFFETVKLILKLWSMIQSIIAMYKKKNAEAWESKIIQDVLNYNDLVNAKTLEERKAAEKKVADDWFRK
jgi:hypothetical protein